MKKKLALKTLVTLLLLGMSILTLKISLGRAEPGIWYVDDDGGADFTLIQDAIDAAWPGDTIYVYNGFYYERLQIRKPLTLIGEDRSNTIIDGGGIRAAISVYTNNVAISEFTVQNGGWDYICELGSSILLFYVSSCSIKNTILLNSRYGISVVSFSIPMTFDNNIVGNIISETEIGIYLYQSDRTTIVDNDILDNEYGVWIQSSSDHNHVAGNNIIGNYWVGILLTESHSNSISENNITNNYQGIQLSGYSNTNDIFTNIIASNFDGIYLVHCSDNHISGNTIEGNADGIYLATSVSNTNIYGNIISENNLHGIWLGSCSNNRFYHNNFINNMQQTYSHVSGYSNFWDDGYPSGGNYWSDYEDRYPDATEIDDSGIWDMPYVIGESNQDNYPLMEPWSPLPRNIDELRAEIEEMGSQGEIDNQGIVKSLIAKLNVAQKLVDKGKIDEAKSILEEDFIPQVQNLTSRQITPEAADLLIESAEYILSHL